MKSYDLTLLSHADPKIKYAEQKRILKIAQKTPAVLYDDLQFFVELLNSKNNILVWTGLLVIGYLARADSKRKMDAALEHVVQKLRSGALITAANAIQSLAEVIKVRPDLADHIVDEILKVKDYTFQSVECHHIVKGHALKQFGRLWGVLSRQARAKVIDFAQTELKNPRPATARKAEQLIRISRRATAPCN